MHLNSKDFNPLRREGGDPTRKTGIQSMSHFNPLRREGGDTLVAQFWARDMQFQSTPPRGRRLCRAQSFNPQPEISIHSAARAETTLQNMGAIQNFISIHSAARAETDNIANDITTIFISIHSAARAETLFSVRQNRYL